MTKHHNMQTVVLTKNAKYNSQGIKMLPNLYIATELLMLSVILQNQFTAIELFKFVFHQHKLRHNHHLEATNTNQMLII